MDKQDEYDDSFASKGKSTTALSYNFESEYHIVVNLQKAKTTVDEEGSEFFIVKIWKKTTLVWTRKWSISILINSLSRSFM